MPLPQFLALIVLVILAAALTIWAASSAGMPMAALAVSALLAAGLVRLVGRDH